MASQSDYYIFPWDLWNVIAPVRAELLSDMEEIGVDDMWKYFEHGMT